MTPGETKHRTRWALVAVVAACLLLLPLGVMLPSSAAVTAENAIIDGDALAAAAVAVGAFNPDFDFWPVYSSSSTDNSFSHGLSGAFWPGFLVDATFFQFGFQDFERAGMGISESQFPTQPHDASASSSAFMRSNFAVGCDFLFGSRSSNSSTCNEYARALVNPPGSLGESETHSNRLTSTGLARGTRFTLPGVVDAAEAVSRTSSRFDAAAGRTVVESSFTARDVTLGGIVHVDKIVATSTAVAGGTPETSTATSKITIVNARSGDSVVTIDDQGMHMQGDSGTDGLNAAFAAQGLEVRLVQGRQSVDPDGQIATSSTGGLKIRMFRERAEEAFPALVRQNRQAACDASQRSPFNREITRVEQTFPNPLYGKVPMLPTQTLPKDVTINQSVPPPASCPFLNRDMEIAFVLGRTDASARLTPLPDFGAFAFTGAQSGGGVQPVAGNVPVVEPSFDDGGSGPGALGVPAAEGPSMSRAPAVAGGPVGLVAAQSEHDVAGRLRLVYGGLLLMGLIVIGGPFMLRKLAAP